MLYIFQINKNIFINNYIFVYFCITQVTMLSFILVLTLHSLCLTSSTGKYIYHNTIKVVM